ncbi:response regulator [Microaerobacter geothermalis]|uniref:response regulator n=1 Tax=Microaerobacter geothermalis TaxID=674972 RepID=UPI001F3242C5|nr:response regulator [Microaerobacter geothermalis]MCF6095348.1 response regulator [Microaerobacter geothermalis]
MKAIIIDDEAHVREAIQLLADWHRYGIDTIYEANDGEEAMELIMKHRPEIIFTDMMMPRKDGVALLQWIQEQGLESKIIVISGFDDYKFMRTAIHYGSYDYILKPIDEKILNQTLENAVNDWNLDEEERKIELKNSMKLSEVENVYLDYLFTHLLGESSNHAYLYKKIKEEFNLNCQMECQVVIVYLNPLVKKIYQGNMDLCYFSLLNIFNEYLRNNNIGIAFRNLNKEDEIVLLAWKELHNFNYLLRKMYWSVFDTLELSCVFAIGNKDVVSNLQQSYEVALNVLNKVNLINMSGKIPIFDGNDLSAGKLIHLFDYSQEIGLAIFSGNEKHLMDTLNEVFTALKNNNHISLEQLEIWEKEYQILRVHWLDEIGINSDDIQDEQVFFWEEHGSISLEKYLEEKRKQFTTLFFTYHKEKKEKNIIYEIKQFLEQNYQQDIKLHHISERFYLSREYISRKFKQEYNVNITDYIVNIRMNKAKELLTYSNLRICEISNLVGYQDEKYFDMKIIPSRVILI